MSIDYILLLVFILLMSFFLWKQKNKIVFNKILFPLIYFVMYKSNLGLDKMDKLAKKFPRLLDAVSSFGTVFCFIAMLFSTAGLFYIIRLLFEKPDMASIGIVLPVEIKGVAYIPFSYWIIAIAVIAVVHEFSHGVIARLHKIPVKSSGFAFLGIILPVLPAAFVEPDEKKLAKAHWWHQLCMISAGPFSNFIAAIFFFLIILLVFAPLAPSFIVSSTEINSVVAGGPAQLAGLKAGDIISFIDNEKVKSGKDVVQILSAHKPNETVVIKTKDNEFSVKLGAQQNDKPLIGVSFEPYTANPSLFEYFGKWPVQIFIWFLNLFELLINLNVSVGAFNLLPIGPIDGGRMFKIVLERLFPKRANGIHKTVSLILLFIVVYIVAFPMLRNFLM